MTNNVQIEPMPDDIVLEEDSELLVNVPKKKLEDRVIHLGRIMESQGRAVEQLYEKLNAAVAENEMLGKQRDTANENSQKQIAATAQHIQQSAEKEAKLTDEIMRLRGLLKRAKAVVEDELLADIKAAL